MVIAAEDHLVKQAIPASSLDTLMITINHITSTKTTKINATRGGSIQL